MKIKQRKTTRQNGKKKTEEKQQKNISLVLLFNIPKSSQAKRI